MAGRLPQCTRAHALLAGVLGVYFDTGFRLHLYPQIQRFIKAGIFHVETPMKRSVTAWLTKGLASVCFLSYLPARLRGSSRSTGAGLIGTALGLLTARWIPTDPVPGLFVVLGG